MHSNNLDWPLSPGGKEGGRGQRGGALAPPPTHCPGGAEHTGTWEVAARLPVYTGTVTAGAHLMGQAKEVHVGLEETLVSSCRQSPPCKAAWLGPLFSE